MTLYEASFLGEKKAVSRKKKAEEDPEAEPKPKRVRKPKAPKEEKKPVEKKAPRKKKEVSPPSPPPIVADDQASVSEEELEKVIEEALAEDKEEDIELPPKKRQKKKKIVEVIEKVEVEKPKRAVKVAPVHDDKVPPLWFKKWNEAELRKSKKVPVKKIREVAAEESTKQWNDGHTRDKLRNEMDNHQSRMYNMIFGRQIRK